MGFPLLQTKLYIPPRRSQWVSRDHLLRRLSQALRGGQRLVLISAMAGAGKTTLLSEWVSKKKDAYFAWLSLDEQDNDPSRFWAYLAAALRGADESLGLALLQAVQSPQPLPIQYGLSQMINAAAGLTRKVVIILDDYHAISNRMIHEGLSFLLDNLPAQMLLVLATRADPPLPVGRLRGRGQLTELRAADL